jgi:hypothetical protein
MSWLLGDWLAGWLTDVLVAHRNRLLAALCRSALYLCCTALR